MANGGSSSVSTFLITAQTGELTSVIGSPFATGMGAFPHGLVFEQGALLTANSDPEPLDWSISVMADQARTGKLTAQRSTSRACGRRTTWPQVRTTVDCSSRPATECDWYWNFEWDLILITSRSRSPGGQRLFRDGRSVEPISLCLQ